MLKDILIEQLTKDGKLIPARTTKKWLESHNLYNQIENYYDDSESIPETIYRIINDINIRPVCNACGQPVKFSNGQFSRFCSAKCRNNDPSVLEKNAENVSKSLKEVYKQKGDKIKEARRKTNLERYGVDSCSLFASEDFQEKSKDAIKSKYGVDNIFKLKEFHNKSILSNREKSINLQKERGYNIEYLEINGETKILVKNGCSIHGDLLLDTTLFNNRTKLERYYLTLCPYCNPMRNPETSIESELKTILNDLQIKYEQHNRTLIHPYELDFYLPDYNIAIECNGIYWHSGFDNGKRLMQKRNLCNNKNIRLLYFWENDIHQRTNIIKNYLKSICGLNNRIFARKCQIKEIDSKASREFIEINHLQGNINASVRLGLFYNNELIEVMTFGKQRKCFGEKPEKGTYELYRLCSKGGYTVVGGASKLLQYFINMYNPNRIITFCSNDISDGNVYEKIGFKFIKECGQGFCYINKKTGERKHRFALRKSVVNDGTNRTADEINLSNGWFKCYDSGNKKFEFCKTIC